MKCDEGTSILHYSHRRIRLLQHSLTVPSKDGKRGVLYAQNAKDEQFGAVHACEHHDRRTFFLWDICFVYVLIVHIDSIGNQILRCLGGSMTSTDRRQ